MTSEVYPNTSGSSSIHPDNVGSSNKHPLDGVGSSSVYPNTTGSLFVNHSTCDISSITNNTNQKNLIPQCIIPMTMIPFVKKDANSQANKYVDTQYGLTIAPSLSNMNNLEQKIAFLSKTMLEIRDDVINSAKTVYDSEVQNRINQLLMKSQQWNNFLSDTRLSAIIGLGKSVNIFKYLSEHFGTDIVSFVEYTSPIFLSPVILHKGWITKLKASIEAKYRFTIAKVETYDTVRCENFVRIIAHKNIKNRVEKWYSKNLSIHGCKLLTKKPKGNMPINATIVINHPFIDGTFQESKIYIVKTKFTFNDRTLGEDVVSDAAVKYISEMGKP